MPISIRVPFYPAAVSGLLCVVMLAAPASANIKNPLIGCGGGTSNCADDRTNTPTTSGPPRSEETSPSNVQESEAPEYEAMPLVLTHPEFFGFNNQDSNPPPSLSSAITTASSDPVPEPASLAVLGSALLWLRWARARRGLADAAGQHRPSPPRAPTTGAGPDRRLAAPRGGAIRADAPRGAVRIARDPLCRALRDER